MESSAPPSATEDRHAVGVAVVAARRDGCAWKDLERRFDRDRTTLWRWALAAGSSECAPPRAPVCNKKGSFCNISALEPATSSLDALAMEDLACTSCPHWLRSKAPDRERFGRCRIRGVETEAEDYCGEHPVLVGRRTTELASAIGTALAGAMAGVLRELKAGEPGSPASRPGRGKR